MKRLCLATAALLLAVLPATGSFAADNGRGADSSAVTTTGAVVDWEQLGKFVPDTIDGYVAGELEGGNATTADPATGKQMNHSNAQRTFTRETTDGETMAITITIMDTGLAQLLLQPYLSQAQMEYDGPDGSMKSIVVDGRKATQVINYGASAIDQGVIFTILKDRVVVAVNGEGMEDSEPLLAVAKSIDYDGLEKLVK